MTDELTINGPESRERTARYSLDYLVSQGITPCSLSSTETTYDSSPVIGIDDAKLILDYFCCVFKRSPRDTREQLRQDLTSRIRESDRIDPESPEWRDKKNYFTTLNFGLDHLVNLAKSLSPGEVYNDFVSGDNLGEQSVNLWHVSNYFDYNLGIDISKLKIKKPFWIGSEMPVVKPVIVHGTFAQMADQIERATSTQVPFQFKEYIGGTLKKTLQTKKAKRDLLRFAEAYAQNLYQNHEFSYDEARNIVLSNIATGYAVSNGDASLMFLNQIASAPQFERINGETPILQRVLFESSRQIGNDDSRLDDRKVLTIDVPYMDGGQK